MNKDSLGDRMKDFYENRSKTYLTRKVPVILRLDGKSFHTFTKGFVRPYDEVFHECMEYTTRKLCEQIQGCKIGYTQSDEITLLLTDTDTINTDCWFGYSVQKMCSVAASIATLSFNQRLYEIFEYYDKDSFEDAESAISVEKLQDKLFKATFDCRCFNIPPDEVINCFIWRQQDATRNAIQMLGQCYFSHKELDCKSCSDIQDMLFSEKAVNFNDMPTAFKRGVCCIKECVAVNLDDGLTVERSSWVIDYEIPIFTQDREYINKYLVQKEDNEDEQSN